MWKYERGMEHVIKNYDVIPLLTKVFAKAFGQVDINQMAIADHGWGPLNRKLLEHSSLCHPNDTFSHLAQILSGLNIENADGIAASVLDWIM